ncbi:hypothetical protein AABC73_22860 [Pseudomonas sp. G.S.17]|uniref:hypothetical protein n=1 Tax=Pseudomonas sp. G.S.17 TaxID=3137451 RepID=UPI00311CC140
MNISSPSYRSPGLESSTQSGKLQKEATRNEPPESIDSKAVRASGALSSKPASVISDAVIFRRPNCLFGAITGMTAEENLSREDRYGRMVDLMDSECCWTCRTIEAMVVRTIAQVALEDIKSELVNFKAFLALSQSDLSEKPFLFTVDGDGEVCIVDSNELNPIEKAILTQAIRDYKSLSSAIQYHAKILIQYSSYFKPEADEEPLTLKNFSRRVDYGALLSNPTNFMDMYGNGSAMKKSVYPPNFVDIKA